MYINFMYTFVLSIRIISFGQLHNNNNDNKIYITPYIKQKTLRCFTRARRGIKQ